MLPFSPITCAIIVSQATLVWSMASVQVRRTTAGVHGLDREREEAGYMVLRMCACSPARTELIMKAEQLAHGWYAQSTCCATSLCVSGGYHLRFGASWHLLILHNKAHGKHARAHSDV